MTSTEQLIQASIKEEDVPIANAITVFSWQLGGAVAIAAGQAITISTITDHVGQQLPNLSPPVVITAGAASLQHITEDPKALGILRSIWNLAVSRTLLLSLAAVCATVPFTIGMQWLNAKRVSDARSKSDAENQTAVGGGIHKGKE